MFFNFKKEEVGAVNRFKKSCTFHGLSVKVSQIALEALKQAVIAKNKKEEVVMTERDVQTLARRGLVRVTDKDEIVITELGLLVIALAEAGDLITIRSPKP